LQTRLQVVPGLATAALHAVSVAIAAGALGCIASGNLATGARMFLAGLAAGGALFGYRLWRASQPPRGAFLDNAYHAPTLAGPEAEQVRVLHAGRTGKHPRSLAGGPRRQARGVSTAARRGLK
jgi:hypothetical protein